MPEPTREELIAKLNELEARLEAAEAGTARGASWSILQSFRARVAAGTGLLAAAISIFGFDLTPYSQAILTAVLTALGAVLIVADSIRQIGNVKGK